jgi:putative peptidoglycan lipid II flippase
MKTEFRMFRHVGLVSLGTLSSRILGLIREVLMASTFGTTGIGSAFFVAFTIPNLFRRLFGEGALSAAFVPQYIRLREGPEPEKAAQTTRSLMQWLVTLLGKITFLVLVLASIMLEMDRWGTATLTTLLCLRILMPYVIGICLAALMMGVLNAHRRYVLPAFTPCLLNLIWIGTLLGLQTATDLTLEEKVLWVAWAILGAGFLQFGVQAMAARRHLRAGPPADSSDPELRLILTRMAPAVMGAAVTQINVLLDRLLAFWVGDYGPAALAYSERLLYLPLGLFATALGTILLPEFSAQVQRKDDAALSSTLDRSLRVITFIMLPASVGMAVLSTPIIQLVYERGVFDAESTLLTARVLLLYTPGLLVFSLAKVFVPIFHAHGDTRTPMRVGAAAVGANLAFNLICIATFPAGWKHAGLAAGTVLSVLLQVGILAMFTHRRYTPLHPGRLLVSFGRQSAACLPLIVVAIGFPTLATELPALLRTPLTILLAAAAYFAATWLLRCPEWRELRDH